MPRSSLWDDYLFILREKDESNNHCRERRRSGSIYFKIDLRGVGKEDNRVCKKARKFKYSLYPSLCTKSRLKSSPPTQEEE
jgi:hypothetical protein